MLRNILLHNARVYSRRNQIKPKKTNSGTKFNPSRHLWSNAAALLLLGTGMASHPSQATPIGGIVSKGAAVIATDGQATNITQTTKRAAIYWRDFTVAEGEAAHFAVPDNGVTLNYIYTSSRTKIMGQVTSNGTLYFVNKNGFVFGPNSSVTAKNLLVTTHMIALDQFMSNQTSEQFTPSDNRAAIIILNGAIHLADGGCLGVFGYEIETTNTAKIEARHGEMVLAAGGLQKINFDGEGGLNFVQTNSTKPAPTVLNEGVILAPGGRITLIAQASPNFANALVENTGRLDSSDGDKTGGMISLAAVNGLVTINQGQGQVTVGLNGSLNLHQGSAHSDTMVDEKFLRAINYQPSMNLNFTSDRDIITTSPILGNHDSQIRFTAAAGITIQAKVSAGGLNLTALYIRAEHDLVIGAGGLNLTATGTAWHTNQGIMLDAGKAATGIPFLVTDGGNITLTAQHGGTIYVNNPIAAQNITMTSDGGGIGLYGAVTANHAAHQDGTVTLTEYHSGNIWVQGDINANNMRVKTDGGAIDFFGKIDLAYNQDDNGRAYIAVAQGGGGIRFHNEIAASQIRIDTDTSYVTFDKAITLKMYDPQPRFDDEADRGKIPTNPKPAIQGGILRVISSGRIDVTFAPGAVIKGISQVTRYLRGEPGNPLVAVTDVDHQARAQEINIVTTGVVAFNDDIGVRAGGLIHLDVGNFRYKNINADHANLAISLTDKNKTHYAYPTPFYVNEHVNFDQAESVSFEINGPIGIYKPLNAKNLTIKSGQINFFWRGRIEGQPGGSVSLWQARKFVVDARLLGLVPGLANVDLALGSDGILVIDPALRAGIGKNITLTGGELLWNHEIIIDGGSLTLNELASGAGNAVQTNQDAANRLKLYGESHLVLTSLSNMEVTAQFAKFNSLEFKVTHGSLTINAPQYARQHIGLFANGDLTINQPVLVDRDDVSVVIVTPDNRKFLHYGHEGHSN